MGGVLWLQGDTVGEQKAARRAISDMWPHVARGWDADLYGAIGEYRTELQRMETVLLEAKPVRVRFCLPILTTREGTEAVMATNIPVDRALRVPLRFLNAAGSPVPGPVGGSVSISDGTAAEVTTDDVSVLISSLGAVGTTFTVAYTNGRLTTGEVEFALGDAVDGGVVIPTDPTDPVDPNAPASVGFDLMGATLETKAAAPTPTLPNPPTDGSLPAAPEATPA